MIQDVLERRIGFFYVSFKHIEKYPFDVMKIMGKTIIFNAETDILKKRMRYKAWCPKFKVIEETDFCPIYEFLYLSMDIVREIGIMGPDERITGL